MDTLTLRLPDDVTNPPQNCGLTRVGVGNPNALPCKAAYNQSYGSFNAFPCRDRELFLLMFSRRQYPAPGLKMTV
jgi:hypothetical protein